ncbi:MAG: ATP-binding protein [bacterium]
MTIVLQDGMFSIQDTGIGMSKSFITRIGERFIREDKATKVNYEGVGLGLSIVYKIAQIYGWKIDITSEQEKGTMIKVCFTDKTDKER